MASPLAHESVWYEKSKYEAAERQYYEKLAKLTDEKDLVRCNMLKVVETTTNQVNDSNINSAANKDEKRSKKEKKNKKEKKEKDVKKGQKNVNFIQDNKQSYVENSVGGWNNKLKGKPNGVHSGVKGYSSVAVKGTELPCNTVGNNIFCQVGDNHIETKNASSNSPMKQSLASEVAKARQHIKQSLECMDGIAAMAGSSVELVNRINGLEKENASLHKVVADLKNLVISLDGRVKSLEGGKPSAVSAPPKASKKEEEDDDGVDLFGSDSEDEGEEAAKVREARLAAYADKKSKKPALIAKSNIILSVSPWDDETDMKKLEECVRTIQMDGLLWGVSKLVPLAYGIHKLHISCVVEDDKVSIDLLQEQIQEFEDYVQSCDIAAFNKV